MIWHLNHLYLSYMTAYYVYNHVDFLWIVNICNQLIVEIVFDDCFWLPDNPCLTCRSSAYQHADVEGDGPRRREGSKRNGLRLRLSGTEEERCARSQGELRRLLHDIYVSYFIVINHTRLIILYFLEKEDRGCCISELMVCLFSKVQRPSSGQF